MPCEVMTENISWFYNLFLTKKKTVFWNMTEHINMSWPHTDWKCDSAEILPVNTAGGGDSLLLDKTHPTIKCKSSSDLTNRVISKLVRLEVESPVVCPAARYSLCKPARQNQRPTEPKAWHSGLAQCLIPVHLSVTSLGCAELEFSDLNVDKCWTADRWICDSDSLDYR